MHEFVNALHDAVVIDHDKFLLPIEDSQIQSGGAVPATPAHLHLCGLPHHWWLDVVTASGGLFCAHTKHW